MIYLTNDLLDQAVYLDLRGKEPQRIGKHYGQSYFGLLGNGIHEVPVSLRSTRTGVDVVFGKSDLFRFVEEEALRKMIGDVVTGDKVH